MRAKEFITLKIFSCVAVLLSFSFFFLNFHGPEKRFSSFFLFLHLEYDGRQGAPRKIGKMK